MRRRAVPFLLLVLLAPGPARAQGWSAAIPFRLEKNLILVPVRVDGGAARTFILDTGAYSMLDTRAADRLRMRRRLVGMTDGIGANQQPVFAPARPYRLSLAGHEVAPRQALIVPLRGVEYCFNAPAPGHPPSRRRRAIHGILGREFFDRYVVEIDYPRRRLRVAEPAGWTPPPGAAPIPIELDPQHVFVRGAIEPAGRAPIAARLEVDTGYAIGLSLNRAFVDAHRLWPPPGRFESAATCGLAGPVGRPSDFAEIGGVRIAGARQEHVATEYSHSQEETAWDGFVGGGFFRRYRLTVALQRSLIILDRD